MSIKRNSVLLKTIIAVCGIASLAGCKTYGPTNLTPASEVLNASCCKPDTETQINFLALRRNPPKQYVLDSGDTLGIFIQGITGDQDVPPPVHFPEDPNLQPALGYPVPIRDDGYISLPLVKPINVEGLTLAQAEERIRKAYTEDKKILIDGNEKIIVTLMRRRTYNVLVIREDGGAKNQSNALQKNAIYLDEERQTESFSLELPAYENDVLHALSETGGMPGERALNELYVMRGGMHQHKNGSMVEAFDAATQQESTTIENANVVVIPIKGEPNTFPTLNERDITLNDGDVVYIKARERAVFYTGGLLEGGRFPLPRDYEIDVLEAIAMAGGSVSAAAGSSGKGGFSGLSNIKPATQVTVMRKCGCQQVAIDVDLRRALADPSERVIVQPGDLIVLEFRRNELLINSAMSVLQFGGVFNLFRR